MVGIRARTRVLALMTVGAMGGAVLTATTSQAAVPEPVVTWPSVTDFNPTVTTYEVQTAYAGFQHLFLVGGLSDGSAHIAQPLPSNATTPIDFDATADGYWTLSVVRCAQETYDPLRCTLVGEQHHVGVFDEVVATVKHRDLRGPAMPFTVEAAPVVEGGSEVAWEVVPAGQPDATPLVAGETHAPAYWHYDTVLPEIGASGALVQGGHYRLQMTIRTASEALGSIEGRVATEFEWDAVNAASGIRLDVGDDLMHETIRDADVFYPGTVRTYTWRDSVYVTVLKDAPEVMKRTNLTVTDELGDVVATRSSSGGGSAWNGRIDGAGIAPEGSYTITAEIVDRQDNVESYSADIRVSHERLVQMTKKVSVSPRRSIVQRFVGRCGSVRSPARASWPGSIGLRSEAKGSRCRSPEAQSVQIVHGAYLPESPFDQPDFYKVYDQITVSTLGGAARGARSAYLVQVYWTRGERWVARKQFDGRLEWHHGQQMGANVVQWDKQARRFYVLWSVGLSEGAQYDVKQFELQVRYWGLKPPRSRVVAD